MGRRRPLEADETPFNMHPFTLDRNELIHRGWRSNLMSFPVSFLRGSLRFAGLELADAGSTAPRELQLDSRTSGHNFSRGKRRRGKNRGRLDVFAIRFEKSICKATRVSPESANPYGAILAVVHMQHSSWPVRYATSPPCESDKSKASEIEQGRRWACRRYPLREREKFIPPGGTRPKGLILRYLIAN